MKRWTSWLSGVALIVTIALAQTGCAMRTAEAPDRDGYYASPVTDYSARPIDPGYEAP